MQSTGQTDPTQPIRCLQMCQRVQGRTVADPRVGQAGPGPPNPNFLNIFIIIING